jgi:hypothetical protein
MKNKLSKSITVIILSFFSHSLSAQSCDICTIFKTLEQLQKINLKFPVIDSLHPTSTKNLSSDLQLTKKELKEIKKVGKTQRGISLDSSYFKSFKIIPALPIYKAFNNTDTVNLKFIEASKPFYIISNPLFFSKNQKAIIDVDFIGSGGYTYILEIKGSKWVICKEILRWVV